MARFFPLLAAVGTAVVAQTTVLNLVIPLDNPETLYGSVVNVEPEATTYVVACPEGSDGFQCLLLNTAQTVIQGPSTVSIHYSYAGDEKNGYFTEDLACKVNFSEDVATCKIQIAEGKKGGSTVTTSVQTTQTALNKVMRPVTMTGGVDKLQATPSSSAATLKESTTASPASSASSMMAAKTSSQVAETTAQSTNAGSSAPMASASASANPAIVNGASSGGLPGSPGALVVIVAFIGAGLM